MLQGHSSFQLLQKSILSGKISVTDIVRHYLSQIEKTNHLNQYLEVYPAEALSKANELDQKISANQAVGKLAGMVISHKDIISYKDHALTASSNILKGYKAKYTATVLQRLLDEDAIIIGRVNCDEFAMGSSNENSAFGAVLNPLDPSRIPGGSSGASATSVASDTCWASIGTDTGGSVRQPAAFCGIVGFKPSYGRISRHGLIAYGSSFDQAGFLSQSVSDAALLLNITQGIDAYDASMNPDVLPEINLSTDKPSSIAYLDIEHFKDAVDPVIYTNYYETVESWKQKGYLLHSVKLDWLDYVIPAYYVMTTAEASSNLSRFDGIRYGHRNTEAKTIDQVYKKSRTEGFGKEVKRRILLGTYVLSAGFYDAYYTKAQKVRRLVKNHLDRLFKDHEALILPISPVMPWKIGTKMDDPVSVYLADIFTVMANVAGIPGVSIPSGRDENGLPIGIQIVSRAWNEQTLLSLADQLSH